MNSRSLIPALLAASFTLACAPAEEDPADAGPTIAPGCAASVCSEVELAASFDCYSPILDQQFTMTAGISGVVAQTTCDVIDAAAAQDLAVMVGPVDPDDDDESAFGFRLRGYTGPGTYPLYHLDDEGTHFGLEITGNNTVAPGTGNPWNTVGTRSCEPQICEAIVDEESEPIANDPNTTHDFRVRVEIVCPAGGVLTDMHCEENAQTRCTLTEAPTLKFDVVCSN